MENNQMLLTVGLPDAQLALLNKIAEQNEFLMKAFSGDVWLDDDAVAKRFGVSKPTINRWRKEMDLPFNQISEVRRYNAKEVDEWFKRYSTNRILKKAA